MIDEIARDMGAVAVAVVTTPFAFEGVRRRGVADEWCQTVVMRKRKTFLKERTRITIERTKGGAK